VRLNAVSKQKSTVLLYSIDKPVIKVQYLRWRNTTFRFGPLSVVVCLFLAL